MRPVERPAQGDGAPDALRFIRSLPLPPPVCATRVLDAVVVGGAATARRNDPGVETSAVRRGHFAIFAPASDTRGRVLIDPTEAVKRRQQVDRLRSP
jgi:hypothetical protein